MMKDTCGICSIYHENDELTKTTSGNLKASTSMLDTSPSKLDSIAEEEMNHHAIREIRIPEERDFDQNPTELYLSLMRKDWTIVRDLAESHPEEASIWIYRRESTGKLRWKLLPLHAAIIFDAPLDVLTLLVNSYSPAVVSKDDQGMVPLHLAIRMGRPADILELLVRTDMTCLDATDRKGRTPRMLASKSPNKDMLQILDQLVMPPVHPTPSKQLELVEEEEKKEEELPEEAPVVESREAPVAQEAFQGVVQPEAPVDVVEEPPVEEEPIAEEEPTPEEMDKPQKPPIDVKVDEEPTETEAAQFPMTPSAVLQNVPSMAPSIHATPSMVTMDELRAMHQKEIEILKETHEKEIKLIKHSQLNQLQKVQESNESVISAVKEEYETKHQNLVEAFEAQKAALKEQAVTQKTEADERIVSLEKAMADLEAAQLQLKSQHDSLVSTHETIVAEKISLENTLDASKTEHHSTEETNKAVIANLVAQVADLQGKLSDLENKKHELEMSKSDLETEHSKTIDSQKEKIECLEEELKQVKFLKKECETALENAEKLNEELTKTTETLQGADSDIRAQLVQLEKKYQEVTASEQELAWKCESLTKQLEEMPKVEETAHKIQTLEKEKADLKTTVSKLSVKLYKVVGFLDEMVQEQDEIINASKSGDSDKLLSNVSGLKSQITTVIDSVIENMPTVSNPEDDNMEDDL